MKQIAFSKTAVRALRRMPSHAAALIRAKIKQYATDPESLGNNVKALRGRDGFRLRVGDWRVIFDEDGRVISVLEIGPRGGAYD